MSSYFAKGRPLFAVFNIDFWS